MKQLFILSILLFGFLVSNAQIIPDSLLPRPKFEIGVEGGPTNADARTFDISTSKVYHTVNSLNNAFFGFALQYNINEIFSIKTGIGVEGKGFEDDYGLPGTPNGYIKSMQNDTLSARSLNYLVVPVLAKAVFTRNHLYFLIDGGFYFGYLLSAGNSVLDFDSSANGMNHYYNSIKDFSRFDFGLAGGLGLGIKLDKRLNLEIEGHINYGLINIASISNVFPEVKNESAVLIVGLRYNLNN